MEKQNNFTPVLRKKSNNELEYIIHNTSDYDKKAVQAAIWILEERGNSSEEVKAAQEDIITKETHKQDKINDQIGIPILTQDWTTRFLHFIVDTILIQGFSYAVALLPFVNFNMLFSFALFPVYYIFFESKFGQTPGKMATDSIVINSNGNTPSFKSVILRTAARYIPFEGLSCLGTPSWGWHDKWTHTYVIRKSDLQKVKK